MTSEEHELLKEYERNYPRSKEVWKEINRRLKLQDTCKNCQEILEMARNIKETAERARRGD